MIDRVIISALMVSSAATAAVTSVAEPYPLFWIIGCACSAAFLIRAATLTQNTRKKKAWTFEIIVTVLTVFLSAVSVVELHPSVGIGTLYGLCIGGVGAGIVGLSRAMGWKVLHAKISAFLAANPPKD